MMNNRIRRIRNLTAAFALSAACMLSGCACSNEPAESAFTYRFASKEEGTSLLLGNEEYYNGLSQNDLDYRMQKKDAGLEEYLAYSREQVLEYTDEEQAILEDCLARMTQTLNDNHFTLPPMDEIIFIKTTMMEENDAGAYTHGSQIYFSDNRMKAAVKGVEGAMEYLDFVLWHEVFHCLTRSNPDFRSDMYQLIHFTTVDSDFPLPPSVMEYHLSNPDVEHHNAYASFRINGQDIDCFVDSITTKHFEKEGDNFFDYFSPALVPIDGSDTYYLPEETENFYDVFGGNTDYVIDPEECMADNFASAMLYGKDGPEGKGYPNPEIIDAILSYVKTN